MAIATLEHINLTVPNPKRTADLLARLFGWRIRWEGPAMAGGYTVHVGTAFSYVALYSPADPSRLPEANANRTGGLNHIAVTVDDLDAMDARVRSAGFETESHTDYEPGRRFYFHDEDGIEYEVVSYPREVSPMEGAALMK